MEHLTGKTLGQYQIVSELGHGGMAVVYKAYQPSLQRFVAIKVLPSHLSLDQDFVRRFQHEAVAAARLKHPNIVTIHDVGAADGINFIVMELVEGESLSSIIRRSGAMPPERVAHIITQVASALDYAHAQGFIHRDIKPSNIMLGANDRVTLMDFGIAKAISGTQLTRTSAIIGTPEYMSPEQIRGQTVDHRADIYSLGIVTYEMLAGQVPFSGDTASVLYKQAHELPPPIRSRAVHVPVHVASALDRALIKDPNQRFATAGAFAQALGGATAAAPAQTTVVPSVLPTAKMETRPPRRNWAIWAIGGAVVLALICVIAIGAAVTIGSLGKAKPDLPPRYNVAEALTSTTTAVQLAAAPPATRTAAPTTAAVAPLATRAAMSPATSTQAIKATAATASTSTRRPTATASNTPVPTRTSTSSPTASSTSACPPVTGPFASLWQSAKDKLGCATNNAQDGAWMAEETFQKGWMFWRKDNDKIYAAFNGDEWMALANTWREGDPNESCSSGTPITPVRGFGKIWCTNSSVRSGLGNATAEERGFYGTVQDFQRGLIIRTDAGKTFLLYSSDRKWEAK